MILCLYLFRRRYPGRGNESGIQQCDPVFSEEPAQEITCADVISLLDHETVVMNRPRIWGHTRESRNHEHLSRLLLLSQVAPRCDGSHGLSDLIFWRFARRLGRNRRHWQSNIANGRSRFRSASDVLPNGPVQLHGCCCQLRVVNCGQKRTRRPHGYRVLPTSLFPTHDAARRLMWCPGTWYWKCFSGLLAPLEVKILFKHVKSAAARTRETETKTTLYFYRPPVCRAARTRCDPCPDWFVDLPQKRARLFYFRIAKSDHAPLSLQFEFSNLLMLLSFPANPTCPVPRSLGPAGFLRWT
ncbi:hypothetical protein F4778DRAFT_642943 [Xylariomycetidae sp. FL2044]|nr:hypothetical protein F4778DRAFT_642943 [Xylariomycetidae sp. FL2044]